MFRIAIVLFLFNYFGSNLIAQIDSAKLALFIDTSWFNTPRSEQPGFGILILEKNKPIYSRCIGDLNVKRQIPITPESKMAIASISKQFTAAIILLLEEKGLLSTEDDVRKYIPELPQYSETVRLKHLLSHTSGMQDHIEMMAIEKKQNRKYYSFEGTLEKLQRFNQLMFQPGSDFAYSNSGYVLLAIVAERVAKKKFELLAKDLIFDPLKMTNSEFSYLRREKEFGYSIAYRYDKKKLFTPLKMEEVNALGATGIYTSLNDFSKWDNQIKNNVLGWSDAMRHKFFQTYNLNDERNIHYNNGLKHRNFHGDSIIEHAGGWAFYNSQYTYIPSKDLSILIFTNNEYDYSIAMVEKILEFISPNEMDELAPEPNYSFLYLNGTYFSEHGLIRSVVYEDGWLKLKGSRMVKGKEQQYVPSDNLCFVANYSLPLCFSIPKMSGTYMTTAETTYFQVERTYQKWEQTSIDKEEFVGKYASNQYPNARIKIKKGDLYLKIGKRKEKLKEYENGLYSFDHDGYCIAFTSSGFKISNKRVINLEFTKVK